MSNRNCIICLKENSIYTCPDCSKRYCSVSCYREHKNQSSNCQKSIPEYEIDRGNVHSTNLEYSTEDTVPIEKLQLLDSNEQLKSLIRGSKSLRNILSSIDRSPDPSFALKNAMKSDWEFRKFAELCLKTLEEDGASLVSNYNEEIAVDDKEEIASRFISLLNSQISNEDVYDESPLLK